MVFISILMSSFKFFPLDRPNRPQYIQFSMQLLAISMLIFIISLALHLADLSDTCIADSPFTVPSEFGLIFKVAFEIAQWGRIVVKSSLVVIAISLKRQGSANSEVRALFSLVRISFEVIILMLSS